MGKYNSNTFYFIKLPDKFINGDQIKWVEGKKRGAEIVIFFIRLLIIAKNRKGNLCRIIGKKEIPFTYEEIASETHTTKEFVKMALNVLEEVELVEFINDHYYIELALELTNQTTEGAEYMRNYRLRQKEKSYICNDNCKTDIEKENRNNNKNRELDIEIDFNYNSVIDYLNKLIGSNYQLSETIVNLINKQIKNGYKENDFIKVINKKYNEWINTDYKKYIRPETLFGEKFETYLNQPETKKEKRYNEIDFESLYAN